MLHADTNRRGPSWIVWLVGSALLGAAVARRREPRRHGIGVVVATFSYYCGHVVSLALALVVGLARKTGQCVRDHGRASFHWG